MSNQPNYNNRSGGPSKKRKRNKKIELNNQAKDSIPLYSNKKIKITVDDDQNNHNNSQSNINKPMIGAIKPPFKKHKKVKRENGKKGNMLYGSLR